MSASTRSRTVPGSFNPDSPALGDTPSGPERSETTMPAIDEEAEDRDKEESYHDDTEQASTTPQGVRRVRSNEELSTTPAHALGSKPKKIVNTVEYNNLNRVQKTRVIRRKDYESDSSRGEGPSKKKGKGPDPGLATGVGLIYPTPKSI